MPGDLTQQLHYLDVSLGGLSLGLYKHHKRPLIGI
jgi:hypothetical protein